MNFEKLSQSFDVPLIKLSNTSDQLPQVITIDGDIVKFAKETKSPVVFVRAFIANEFFKVFFKNSSDTTSTYIKILQLEQKNILEKINNLEDANTAELQELSQIEKSLNHIINSDHDKDFVDYEVFVPFNGQYYSSGRLIQTWIEHKDCLHKAESEYLRSLIRESIRNTKK